MKRLVYADNAATTKLDIEAFEAMKPYLLDEYGNASQPYAFARSPKAAIKKAREVIAKCINAKPEEIYFTSGGTESDNWAIKGAALAHETRGAVIASAIEHHAVLRACASLERLGVPVAYVWPNTDGVITQDALSEIITNNTALVSVMMSNNETGVVQPISELAKIAHMHGAVFHTDAVQCLGHVSVDVQMLGVDILSASAHKFNGPKGVGFLYVKTGTPLIPLMDGGAQEKGNRAGTENVAAIVAMAVALENNLKHIGEQREHIKQLENLLLALLTEYGINYVRNGAGEMVPGNISIGFPGFEGEAILHRLDLLGVQVSTGSACDSVNTQISHVLKAMKVDTAIAKGTIRVSLGKYNNEEDVVFIADAIKKIING